jgi:hypothetical protein
MRQGCSIRTVFTEFWVTRTTPPRRRSLVQIATGTEIQNEDRVGVRRSQINGRLELRDINRPISTPSPFGVAWMPRFSTRGLTRQDAGHGERFRQRGTDLDLLGPIAGKADAGPDGSSATWSWRPSLVTRGNRRQPSRRKPPPPSALPLPHRRPTPRPPLPPPHGRGEGPVCVLPGRSAVRGSAAVGFWRHHHHFVVSRDMPDSCLRT